VAQRDVDGNAIKGDVILRDSHDCLVLGEHGLTTLIGVNNLAVVTTDDAVLITALDRDQDVREIVDRLRQDKRGELVHHSKVRRPWGWFRLIQADAGFQLRYLSVKPGASLSLQRHRRRAEHWVVVSGTARVTCGDAVLVLGTNQSTFIPAGSTHRLENPGSEILVLIEVQSGAYLAEDDVERLDEATGNG
jgi:mannose-1-phosphate guanylyltransferase/mannose-6-phosphate isomerase